MYLFAEHYIKIMNVNSFIIKMEENIKNILQRLKRSKFRSLFHLKEKDILFIQEHGINKIRRDGLDLMTKRLKIKTENDGRQTPWEGHPVFVAQHATATCCRKCIQKWHRISQEKKLSENEINYLVELAIFWIKSELFILSEKAKI
jgi:hypothetical protein